MMSFMHTFGMRLLIILTTGMFIIAGCKNNTSGPEEEDTAPTVPPVSSFQLDFDNFPSTKPIVGQINPKTLTRNNWTFSAINVGVWQTLLTIGMVIPVAAFKEAFNHEAVQQEDGSWIRSYSFTPLGGVLHTASLRAVVNLSGIDWEMRISKDGQFEDFLWYTGTSNLLLTEGTWSLNKDPENPTPWIDIVWNRNIVEGTGDIKYTNAVPGDPENGGYIFFGTTNDSTYNTFYDIFNKGNNNLTSIQWHRTTEEGHVRDARHFGDTEWHCWDGNLDDLLTCPLSS